MKHPDLHVELYREQGRLMGRNASGVGIVMGPPSQDPQATSPMEMILQALAGCSSVDVLGILDKQRAQVNDYRVRVKGRRDDSSGTAAPFSDIVLEFRVDTDAAPEKVVRAVELSLQKYCSVAKMLESTVCIHPVVLVNDRRVFPTETAGNTQDPNL